MLELGPDDVADCRDASVAGLADVSVWSEGHPTSRFPATSTTSLTNFSTNNYYHHHPLLLKGSIPSKPNTLSSTYYFLQKICSSDQQKFQLLIPTEALRVHRPRSQPNHLQSQLGAVEPRNRYTSLPINRSKLTIFRRHILYFSIEFGPPNKAIAFLPLASSRPFGSRWRNTTGPVEPVAAGE